MEIRIRLFARQRQIAGSREVIVDVPATATIEDAWAVLVARHPALADGRRYVRFARNGEYAAPSTALEEGDEIAFIPPVSGGATDAAASPPDRILELAPAPLPADLGSALAERLVTTADGAVVIFEGRTRETPGTPAPGEEAEARRHAGRSVQALEYEAFEPLAIRVLGEIADSVAARFGVERLAIVHAVGEVPLGAVSVVIVACAPHREQAFDAARFAMDETKVRAPIWKAERFVDGQVWIGQPAATGLSDDDAGPGLPPAAHTPAR
jgi:molybdopterin synthase catalytic subunit